MMALSHPATDMTDTAQIITSYGRRFIVRTADGHSFEATTRKNGWTSPAATKYTLRR